MNNSREWAWHANLNFQVFQLTSLWCPPSPSLQKRLQCMQLYRFLFFIIFIHEHLTWIPHSSIWHSVQWFLLFNVNVGLILSWFFCLAWTSYVYLSCPWQKRDRQVFHCWWLFIHHRVCKSPEAAESRCRGGRLSAASPRAVIDTQSDTPPGSDWLWFGGFLLMALGDLGEARGSKFFSPQLDRTWWQFSQLGQLLLSRLPLDIL